MNITGPSLVSQSGGYLYGQSPSVHLLFALATSMPQVQMRRSTSPCLLWHFSHFPS